MISAEMARIAAVESLCPTDAILAETGYPTLARHRVFDSRRPLSGEIVEDAEFTPTLSLFTRKAESARRGPGQGSASRNGRTLLEVVAELAVSDQDENGLIFVDALAGDHPQGRIALAALCSQVRHVLTRGETGKLFRMAVMAIDAIDEEGFAVPELGLRWQRTTMLFDCQIPDDDFDGQGGLPEPARSIAALLHPQSYAKSTLDGMAAQFSAAEPLPALETIAFEVKQAGVSGQAGTDDAVGPPFTEIED